MLASGTLIIWGTLNHGKSGWMICSNLCEGNLFLNLHYPLAFQSLGRAKIIVCSSIFWIVSNLPTSNCYSDYFDLLPFNNSSGENWTQNHLYTTKQLKRRCMSFNMLSEKHGVMPYTWRRCPLFKSRLLRWVKIQVAAKDIQTKTHEISAKRKEIKNPLGVGPSGTKINAAQMDLSQQKLPSVVFFSEWKMHEKQAQVVKWCENAPPKKAQFRLGRWTKKRFGNLFVGT